MRAGTGGGEETRGEGGTLDQAAGFGAGGRTELRSRTVDGETDDGLAFGGGVGPQIFVRSAAARAKTTTRSSVTWSARHSRSWT